MSDAASPPPSPDGSPPAPRKRRFVDEEIARQGRNIHTLKAKDSTGRWASYFVLVKPHMERRFLQALESNGMIDLETYGKVIASCYGEEPTQELKDFLKEKYGFIV
jgi:hypothetical protein